MSNGITLELLWNVRWLYNGVSALQMINIQVVSNSSHPNGLKHHIPPQTEEKNNDPTEQSQTLHNGMRKVGIYTIS